MNIHELLQELSYRNITLSIDGDYLDIEGDEDMLSSELIDALQENKAELLLRLKEHSKESSRSIPFERVSREGNNLPLSLDQERLWRLIQQGSDNSVYNINVAFHISGRLNQIVLDKSIKVLCDRHEVLRTTFPFNNQGRQGFDHPCQVIAKTSSTSLEIEDFRSLNPDEFEDTIERTIRSFARQPLDITTGPLFQIKLLWIAPKETILLFKIHHIIADYWSLNILFSELSFVYSSLLAGKPVSLPDLPIQYVDYAVWQRNWLQGDVLEQKLRFWQERFEGNPASLKLPSDVSHTQDQSYQGECLHIHLSKGLSNSLKSVCQQNELTLFVLLLTGFGIVLHCYTYQEDLIIASPLAGRDKVGLGEVVGFFNNMLPLRIKLTNDPNIIDILRHVSQVVLEANNNQDIPFQQLLGIPSLQRVNITKGAFALQASMKPPLAGITDLVVKPVKTHSGLSNFDMYLQLWEEEGGLGGLIEYKSGLFKRETIVQFTENYRRTLELIVEDTHRSLSSLEGKIDIPTWSNPELVQTEKVYVGPRDEVESHLVKIWENILGVENISINDNFFELGGNSLLAGSMSLAVEKEFNYYIPLSIIGSQPTIEYLSNIINNKDIYTYGAATGPLLVPLQTRGTKPPLFMVTPMANTPFVFSGLAERLGQDQPFYALKATRDYGDTTSGTIEEMATACIEDMKKVKPNGPYRIGGYCLGVLIAFEMAHQLKREGEKIETLISIDVSPLELKKIISELSPKQRLNGFLYLLKLYYSDYWGIYNFQFKEELASSNPFIRSLPILRLPLWIINEVLLPIRKMVTYSRRALLRYQVHPYEGDLFFIRTHGAEHGNRLTKDMVLHDSTKSPDAEWKKIINGNIEWYLVPGTHWTILNEDNVDEVANHLRNHLDSLQA